MVYIILIMNTILFYYIRTLIFHRNRDESGHDPVVKNAAMIVTIAILQHHRQERRHIVRNPFIIGMHDPGQLLPVENSFLRIERRLDTDAGRQLRRKSVHSPARLAVDGPADNPFIAYVMPMQTDARFLEHFPNDAICRRFPWLQFAADAVPFAHPCRRIAIEEQNAIVLLNETNRIFEQRLPLPLPLTC